MIREELLAICEQAFVPEPRWSNRDSSAAQRQLGELYALLKAGCDFHVSRRGGLASDERTLWVYVSFKGFDAFESGSDYYDHESFYIPTQARLDETKDGDWY